MTMHREASRRKRCLLVGVVVVVVVVAVLAVVLGLTLNRSSDHLRSTVIGRCETFLKENTDVSR